MIPTSLIAHRNLSKFRFTQRKLSLASILTPQADSSYEATGSIDLTQIALLCALSVIYDSRRAGAAIRKKQDQEMSLSSCRVFQDPIGSHFFPITHRRHLKMKQSHRQA